ncbi:glycosyltransferase family 61 protein [Pseudomonas protegens]|uniref:Glycosyltransferase family 61 protein n=1 Tax=Pseudomonas protegens TaxID=380021 RepID=A0A7G7XDN4_9PSED|nr:glycosyltransferase family 61 protein [Pseudomonas protegens]QNH78079.1 glycosyltransferase family 61 protein [Pseudomonas protegens]QNL07275.1 glycosyltransferase family 61 protein [Pseudomonas protegens]
MHSKERAQAEVKDGVRSFLLNRTLLGFIYYKFLKRSSVVRGLIIAGWGVVFPVWMVLLSRFSSKVLKLRILSLSSSAQKVIEVVAQERVNVPVASVFPRRLAFECVLPHESYIFPSIYLAELEDHLVRGGSNFLIGQGTLVCHDLFCTLRDYTSEEAHGRMVISPVKKTSYVFRNLGDDYGLEALAEAAVFTDAVSQNYAHFLTEVLPRIYIFIKNAPSHLPLIVDANLHANLLSAIHLLVGGGREIIPLTKGHEVQVGKLHVVSVCGYVPYERRPRTSGLKGHSQGQFSPTALISMRSSIRSALNLPEKPSADRKIFIRRNSGYRNIVNAQEIEVTLVALGFEVVEPEKLSFSEQVELFSSASIVVGATGAAFANLVFCNPGTRLVIMIAHLSNTSYYYWQNMASACGNQVCYVLGEIEKTSYRSIHSDFYIEIEDVLLAIKGHDDAMSEGQDEAVQL